MITIDEAAPQKVPRDLRYRRQLFPGSDDLVFKVTEKGFVPIPIILRRLLRRLTAPEVRVLLYLHLRSSRYSICYPQISEIVHELGLTSRKNLMPHLKSLEERGFIAVRESSGRTFFLIYDPRVAIKKLLDAGQLTESELAEINDLYVDLNQMTIERSSAGPKGIAESKASKGLDVVRADNR